MDKQIISPDILIQQRTPEELARQRKAVNIFYFGDFKEDSPEADFAYISHAVNHAKPDVFDAEFVALHQQEMDAIAEGWNHFDGPVYTPDEWDEIARFEREKAEALDRETPSGNTEKEQEEDKNRRATEYPIPENIKAIYDRRSQVEHDFLSRLLAFHEKIGTLPDSLKREGFLPAPVSGKGQKKRDVAKELPETSSTTSYTQQTSQETDTLFRAQAEGARAMLPSEKTDKREQNKLVSNFWFDKNNQWLIHKSPARMGKDPSHHVRIKVPAESAINADEAKDYLLTLTRSQNADAIFATCYICEVLLQQPRLQDWLDLEDIAVKIGYHPAKCNAMERNELRNQIWQYIKFCLYAEVHGQRSVTFYDRITGEELPSVIGQSIFAKFGDEYAEPKQPNQAPLRVHLGLNSTFAELLTLPTMRQYIGGMEKLSAIPSGKSGTGWARSIGVALLHQWRMKAKEAIAGKVRMTREELLSRYAPRVQTVQEVLSSNNPARARKYWHTAINELCEKGLISREGPELKKGSEDLGRDGEALPGQGWAQSWLKAEVLLLPSEEMRQHLAELSARQFDAPVRDLSAPKGTRKPRKKALQ